MKYAKILKSKTHDAHKYGLWTFGQFVLPFDFLVTYVQYDVIIVYNEHIVNLIKLFELFLCSFN